MKTLKIFGGSFALAAVLSLVPVSALAQKKADDKKETPLRQDRIIFAVTDDGARIEPIGLVEGGTIMPNPADGAAEEAQLKIFSGLYYKAKTSFDLIFGGAASGKVEVVSNDTSAECARNIANVTVQSPKAKLKGFVMALATNIKMQTPGSGVRRTPTAGEKTEIEKLVRAKMTENRVPATAVLRYHNLTAVDIDNNGKVEIVGSYYTQTTANDRGLLFFIAEKNAAGKFVFGHSKYEKYEKKDLMGGAEIKNLDEGIYHELFLDVLDVDGDGKAEVFTMTQGFEGSTFKVYSAKSGKWKGTFESSNYHCAF